MTRNSRDDQDCLDIIASARDHWFETHPQVNLETDESTDEQICLALGLPATGAVRGLALDLISSSNAGIRAAVRRGLNTWVLQKRLGAA